MNNEQLMQMLVGKTPMEAKHILGERLYLIINMKQPNLARKITDMLLEDLNNSELVTLINDNDALQSKIEEALEALPPDETLAKLKKTLDEIRLLHAKNKGKDFIQGQTSNELQQIICEWLSITDKILNVDQLRKAQSQYYKITRNSNLFNRIMNIHDIDDVFGTETMKDILCEQTITWAQNTTKELFCNWVCDMKQINVPLDIQTFLDVLVKSNHGISNTVQMLMGWIPSAQAQLLKTIADKPPGEAKRILGDRLYLLIATKRPNLAGKITGKITGMLLEGLDNSELVTLINDNDDLQSKIEEALEALRLHDEAGVQRAHNESEALKACMSTSGRIHGEFLRLLYFISNKQADDYFEALGYQPHSKEFCQRRGVFFQQNRGTIGDGLCSGRGATWRSHHCAPTCRCPSPSAAPPYGLR
jgi:hypothetical protein